MIIGENVILTDESGEDVYFQLLAQIEYKDDQYVVLLPLEGEHTDEVVILLVEYDPKDEKGEYYVSVDDLDDLMAVFEIFKSRFKEEFNFTDE